MLNSKYLLQAELQKIGFVTGEQVAERGGGTVKQFKGSGGHNILKGRYNCIGHIF